jgi:hypothetical protein
MPVELARGPDLLLKFAATMVVKSKSGTFSGEVTIGIAILFSGSV